MALVKLGEPGFIRGEVQLRRGRLDDGLGQPHGEGKVPGDRRTPDGSSLALNLSGNFRGFLEVSSYTAGRGEARIGVAGGTTYALDGVIWSASPLQHDEPPPLDQPTITSLKGSFSIVTLDQDRREVRLYADRVRSRNLFWTFAAGDACLRFSSDLIDLTQMMRSAGLPLRRDDLASWHMLTFGYMLDSRTLVEGVQRVSPGCSLVFDGTVAREERYHRFSNHPGETSLSRGQIVDGLEDRFRQAIVGAFGHDQQHGRSHLVTLSGGLDSRSVAVAADQLGYGPLTTCTASVSGYLDQTIASKVAKDLGAENIFYALDNGRYLEDLEPAVRANGGMVFATGSAHLLRLLGLMRLRGFGLLHTGMLGDGALGTFLHGPNLRHREPTIGANSRQTQGRTKEVALPVWEGFENDELFALYTRGFNAVLNGFHTASRMFVSESPFLDSDFLSFALSIPADIRYASTGAGIYRDWILATRGPIGRYRWERTGVSPAWPTGLARWALLGRSLLRRASISPRFPGSMVPMAMWLRTNPRLGRAWDERFERGLGILSDPEIADFASRMYRAGSVSEKGQVLTLVIATEILGLA